MNRRVLVAVGAIVLLSPRIVPAVDFLRGDSNADAAVDLSDALFTLEGLFRDGPMPGCLDAADSNDSGVIDLSDPVLILFHLFASGVEVPAPGTKSCGPDPTADGLDCAAFEPCEGPGPPDLSLLSDRFDGASLDPSWGRFQTGVLGIATEGGSLHLTLLNSALWFQTSRGPFLHKMVQGDFTATATVHARRASAPQSAPTQLIHLGGLMARNPAGDNAGQPENYVFIVLGIDENDLSVETKSTTNSQSNYQGPSWPAPDAELRLCRRGAAFRLYKRAMGSESWTLAQTYVRPDLPETLQVGPVVYGPSATPDLQVIFDEVLFANAPSDASCTSN